MDLKNAQALHDGLQRFESQGLSFYYCEVVIFFSNFDPSFQGE